MSVNHQQLAAAIRALSIDAVEQANSGHPGMPLGIADVATVLFKDFLKFSSTNPSWPDRDRFILSAGHGSMLLYSLLYLTGHQDITLDDLKNFRQLGAKTAGHPEVEMLEAIETTTGPLGQGIANAVGFAFAEKLLSNRFPDLVDHHTYALVGDGCLMEGISQEAISFAGHYKLNKLIVLFDDNNICIDGEVGMATSEDHLARFKACNWAAERVDGHDPEAIAAALSRAKKSDKPSLIACKTTIAFGSPNKAGSSASHGAPLGKEEVELTKQSLNWPHAPFTVPQEILAEWQQAGQRSEADLLAWQKKLAASPKREEFERLMSGALPENWLAEVAAYQEKLVAEQPSVATRKASGNILELFTKNIPELIGGSADLTGSNNTKTKETAAITPDDFSGRYVHYGIREHAMGAIMNGLALHKGVIPYSGTFLVFSDYLKPALRLSALMEQRVIYVFTHDSIGLGEDGPTHQPIEHLDALRLVPNLTVFRPADAYETVEAWQYALSSHKPTALSLTRQNIPTVTKEFRTENYSSKGGYIVSDTEIAQQATIIASGSEVQIALEAQQILAEQNIGVRVVSMPSISLFEQQDKNYQNEILGDVDKIIAIEASNSHNYYKFAQKFIGMQSFGASAKAVDLYEHFEITSSKLVAEILNW